MVKNILYIKNYYQGQNLDYLEQHFNVKLTCVNSTELIDKDIEYIKNLINHYQIIIIGGGPQHLTPNQIANHPEILNQIKLIKMISITNSNILVLGFCLGCQIIGLASGYDILSMDKLSIGFNHLDTNTINWNFITDSNDKYLVNLNYDLLKKSFSYHYDCISIDNNKLTNLTNLTNSDLIFIGFSSNQVPYIIKHKNSQIYGFQFHPEITFNCIQNIIDSHVKLDLPNYSILSDFNSDVSLHFFNIFINL